MSATTDLQDAIATNAQAIARYSLALANDALAPSESYSLDGETTTRNEWREGIARLIKTLTETNNELQKTLNNMAPYWLPTRQILQ